MNATPSRLRSGAWGAKVAGQVQQGDVVTITTRSGKSWDAVVSRVLWTDGAVSICATETAAAGRPARATRTRTGCRCGSIEEYAQASDCPQCED